MEKNDLTRMGEDKGTKSYLQFQIERLKVLQAKLSTEAEEDYVIIKEEKEEKEELSRPNAAQVNMLLDVLEGDPRLVGGKLRGVNKLNAWKEIAKVLNTLGFSKDAKKWMKFWSDKKKAVSMKANARSKALNKKENMDSTSVTQLNDVEERIFRMMGGETVVNTTQSSRAVDPLPTDTRYMIVEDPSQGTQSDNSEVSSDTANSPVPHITSNSISAEQEKVQHDIKTSIHSSPEHEAQWDQDSHDAIYEGPSRLQFKKPLLMNEVSERFLSIEERRLDLETKMVSFMERSLARDEALAEGMKAVGEGMKAIGEGMKAIGEGMKAMAESVKALSPNLNK